MSELRNYLQDYVKTLQNLLDSYPDDKSLLREAKKAFGDDKDDARYLVLAEKMAQSKKDADDWDDDDKPVPPNRPVDKM